MEIISKYAASLRYGDLPASTVRAAKVRIIDSLGCAVGEELDAIIGWKTRKGDFIMNIKNALFLTIAMVFSLVVISTPIFADYYPKELAIGKNVMVSTTDFRATKIALELLKKGWNVVDVAVAVNFMMGVYEPGSVSIGGWTSRTAIYWAKTGEIVYSHANGKAPEKARPDMFELVPGTEPGLPSRVKDRANVLGYKAVVVSPILGAIWDMHKRYGSRPWKEVVEPAIKVAEEGFEAIEEYVKGVKENEKYFRLFPYSTQLMLPDGKVPVVGQKIVFKDLARTLRKIAEHGPDVYYKGEIRDTIVDFIQKNGGILTKNDFTVASKEKYLKNMNALNYRGFIILASHYDGSHLHQMLNILSNFDLKKLGYMTPQSIHLLLEAMKIAYIDRYVYTADPDYMAVPMSGMMSWVYARDRAREIDMSKAKIYKPGDAWAYQPIPREHTKSKEVSEEEMKALASRLIAESRDTTQFSMVDQYGNVLGQITSLRSGYGSKVAVQPLGFFLSDMMGHFDVKPGTYNSIAPFKEAVSNGSCGMVLKDGKPWLVFGGRGGRRIITATLQVLVNMIDFGMDLKNALSAPRVHSEALDYDVEMESRVPESVRKAVENMGHKIKVREAYSDAFADLQWVQIDPVSGILFGFADPRTQGSAMGD